MSSMFCLFFSFCYCFSFWCNLCSPHRDIFSSSSVFSCYFFNCCVSSTFLDFSWLEPVGRTASGSFQYVLVHYALSLKGNSHSGLEFFHLLQGSFKLYSINTFLGGKASYHVVYLEQEQAISTLI